MFLDFLTTVVFIYYLFRGIWALITYTVTCLFIYSVQKRHVYSVAVYIQNSLGTPYSFFLTTENAPLTFHAAVLASKTSAVPLNL